MSMVKGTTLLQVVLCNSLVLEQLTEPKIRWPIAIGSLSRQTICERWSSLIDHCP